MEDTTTELALAGAIFEAALSLDDPATREKFLTRAFGEDLEGMERMKSLLDSSRASTPFFLEAGEARGHIASELFREISPDEEESPSDGPRHDPELIGSAIGQYHLVRCLGAGGGGIVYEAEQREPVRRKVALKIIAIDTESDSAKTRFDIERQALAIMDHPNIAKVLDAGGTYKGSPYFVMELVSGESVTTYCDREKLDIRQRIELFMDICGAIQHAHSKRIIHRDIKPSNVLVAVQDRKPVPKVIDFGIAKAAVRDLKIHPLLTSNDQFVGTPAYMSPEQVEMIGQDVDTRSDIYSLGVLLYELLTSHTPFDRTELVSLGVASMREMLLEGTHPRPSARLQKTPSKDLLSIAAARQTDVSKLLAALRGDLDLVVMKALEKNRNQRYETANSLMQDLRQYLDNKPVSAQHANNIYSFKKFISRNKIPFFSASTVAASILLGFGTSVTLYVRERSAFHEQARLGREAERSRDKEHQLRRQAQARANVSRAAFLLSEGKEEEADELLQTNPLESIEPSKEASSVFRSLGSWYGTYGEWDKAIQCFRLMNQATLLNTPTDIRRGSDLLVTSSALVQAGDRDGYNDFRRDILNRLLPVSDSLEAEHVLKACLLFPTSTEMLGKLEHAADLCEQSINGDTQGDFPGWEAFSLALFHHRRGEHEKVVATGQIGLSTPNIKEICAASIRVLTAMAHHRLGDPSKAAKDLQWAETVIRRDPSRDAEQEKAILPKWYDWSAASILLKEAENAGVAQPMR